MALRLKYFTAFALFGMAPWWSMTNAMRLASRGGNGATRISVRRARQFSQISDRYTTTALGAKKKANEEENPTAPAGWTTIKYGTEQDEKNAEMEDRLRAAERWVSKKLTDKESQELNRVMGIEAEVLAALAEEEDEKSGIKKNGKKVPQDKSSAKTKLKDFLTAETRDAAKVKGFLELNPYICSGCGTPFQSKSTDTPGFLPKDKIKLHLGKAQKIRDKQEAIKILELAGIEVIWTIRVNLKEEYHVATGNKNRNRVEYGLSLTAVLFYYFYFLIYISHHVEQLNECQLIHVFFSYIDGQ